MYDRILIVDDHPNNIAILTELLADDYDLATATSGEEALVVAEQFRPALILLDIMMPGIDGYETCRRLRASPSLRHTKIMMISAKAMVTERLQGYEAGADDYVTKPFELEELQEKVRVYVRLKSLEELDALKSDVLALLSHETATPLNGILGPLEMLREEPEMERAEQTQLLDIIYDSAMNLHELYTKVRRLCAMRAGKWTFIREPVELGAVIQAALDAIVHQIEQQQIEVKLVEAIHPSVELDVTQFQEALMWLLENAIEVSQPESCITIRTWQDPHYIRLSIHDEGPGIDPEYLPHIFEPFVKPNICNHASGQGISLAMAYEILKMHDGIIEVDSNSESGTTFTLGLPHHNSL